MRTYAPQEPGEAPRALPPDMEAPTTGKWPATRPEGFPESLAWPPDPGEMLGVAGLYAGFNAPLTRDGEEADEEFLARTATDYRSRAEWLAAWFREAGLTPEQRAAEAAAYRDGEDALETMFFGSREDRTANGMPESVGWASIIALTKRLEKDRRPLILLNAEMEERTKRGLTWRDRAWWDLELTKRAAAETRAEAHLYEWLCFYSAMYPRAQKEGGGWEYAWAAKDGPSFAEYHGYVMGTVRKALAETRPAYDVAPRRTVAELAEDKALLAPPVVVVPRLAWRGRDTLFAGREKLAGKSTILTAAAAAVTRGGAFLDGEAERGAVLWVSADIEPEADIVQRFLRFGGDGGLMSVRYPAGADYGARLDAIVRDVAETGAALVVVDSLAPFMLVEEASQAAEWTARFAAFRERLKPHGAARIFVHHTTKGTGEYRDSTAIGAMVDQVLYYENPAPRADEPLRKVWGVGRIVGWRRFDVTLSGDAFAVAEERAGDAVIAANETEVLWAWVRDNPLRATATIADALGWNRREATAALDRLKAAGRVAEERGPRHARLWTAVLPST